MQKYWVVKYVAKHYMSSNILTKAMITIPNHGKVCSNELYVIHLVSY